MKAFFLFTSIAVCSVILLSCSKTKDCGCVEPPIEASTWKMISRNGGFGGGQTDLPANKQHELTIFPDEKFSFLDKSTGQTTSGVVKFTLDFQSIYGKETKVVFEPHIPALDLDYYVMLGYPTDSLKLGDNLADGYITIFKRTQP